MEDDRLNNGGVKTENGWANNGWVGSHGLQQSEVGWVGNPAEEYGLSATPFSLNKEPLTETDSTSASPATFYSHDVTRPASSTDPSPRLQPKSAARFGSAALQNSLLNRQLLGHNRPLSGGGESLSPTIGNHHHHHHNNNHHHHQLTNFPGETGSSQSTSSDLDLASLERLPTASSVLRQQQQQQQEVHRPDSVITTSSAVSSEAGEEKSGEEAAAAVAAANNVYTISGLYGTPSAVVSHTPLDPAESTSTTGSSPALVSRKTHKRSTSSTAASIIRGCQNMTHRRSHSHTVSGYNSHAQHKRSASSGFVASHRRTASGALIEALDKITGSVLLDNGTGAGGKNLELQQRWAATGSTAKQPEAMEVEDDFANLRDCGYCGCKPRFAVPLASIKVFVSLLSLLVILQQALSSGYLNSVITTIEKRYEIPSSVSGIIASMYEIGNVFTVIFVSYLGSRRHIPSFIGTGVLVMGTSSIIFSLPHFISSSYSSTFTNLGTNITGENICQAGAAPSLLTTPAVMSTHASREENTCVTDNSWTNSYPVFIFMVAQLLLGCSGSPILTLGTTYIDDHVKRTSSSIYLGFIYSMVAFGPVLGFLLGYLFLGFYVDALTEDVTALKLTSESRHWVGMWWGGFLVCGVLMLAIAVPFYAFPKEMKREKRRVFLEEKMAREEAEAASTTAGDTTINSEKSLTKDGELSPNKGTAVGGGGAEDKETTPEKPAGNTYGQNLKDLPMCVWKLLTNWIYMVTCLGSCAELVIVSGFIVFLPKYLEKQFSLPEQEAALMTGGTAIPGACIGILLGGVIISKLQLKPKGAIKLVLLMNSLCLCCYGFLFFLGCDNVKMAGTTSPYSGPNSTEEFKVNLTASCNSGCTCDINDVQPVCGDNGLTYFSPCHAGCTSLITPGGKNYTDCACIDPDIFGNYSIDSGVTRVPMATAGNCDTECNMLLPFLILLFFMTLMVAVTQMPLLMIVLRCVAEEEKAFALGIQFVIFRLFGYIPSPIMFGAVIDSTCIFWKQTCEGDQGGRCLVYDIVSFRHKYVGIGAGIKALAFLFFLVDWWLIRQKTRRDKEKTGLTVGEVVDSIVSLDKIMDDGEGGGGVTNMGSDLEEADFLEPPRGRPESSDSSPQHEMVSPTRQPMISTSPGM